MMKIRKGHVDWQRFLCGIPARDYVFQDEPYEVQIQRAKDLIKNADAVIIGAGAGASTAAGICYGGKRFTDNFAEFIEKYGNEKTNEIKSGQLVLDKDYDFWLMKFDNVSKNGDHGIEDVPEYTLIEYAYYKMALDAGIRMNECRIYSNAGENHFMTKRFDRVNGKKIHMQSLGAMAHISYKEPRLCSYEMAAGYMREMKLPMIDIEQLFRRMVFNCVAVNRDDHVKNISFLMDRSGKWRLSPAYDITYSYDFTNKWLSAHQMTINGKKSDISLTDLLAAGEKMGLKRKKCMDIISKISLVVSDFESYAEKANIREKTYSEIKKTLEMNKVKI